MTPASNRETAVLEHHITGRELRRRFAELRDDRDRRAEVAERELRRPCPAANQD